jgi:hypothetical protein
MSRHRPLGHLVGRIRFEFAEEAHARRQRIAARMVTERRRRVTRPFVLERVFTEGYRELVLR